MFLCRIPIAGPQFQSALKVLCSYLQVLGSPTCPCKLLKTLVIHTLKRLDEEDVEDLEEAPDDELQAAEEQILDQATAARTIAELKTEIETLKRLESLALTVHRSGADTKWRELASLLGEIFKNQNSYRCRANENESGDGANGNRRPLPKLVIFTEHRDTLN